MRTSLDPSSSPPAPDMHKDSHTTYIHAHHTHTHISYLGLTLRSTEGAECRVQSCKGQRGLPISLSSASQPLPRLCVMLERGGARPAPSASNEASIDDLTKLPAARANHALSLPHVAYGGSCTLYSVRALH